MHSVQGGYTDKALSYADKAIQFMPVDDSKGMTGVAAIYNETQGYIIVKSQW